MTEQHNQQKDKKSYKRVFIGAGIVTIAVMAITAYWLYMKYYPSTDNAYVHANVIHVAPKASGYIKTVHVDNNQYVNKGDLLVEIDPDDYNLQTSKAEQDYLLAKQKSIDAKQRITTAKANVAKAQSDFDFASKMAKRYQHLYDKKAGSLQNKQKYTNKKQQAGQALQQANTALKQAKIAYTAAQTQVDIARIGLENAKMNQSYTQIKAPVSGYIGNLDLEQGQLVSQGEKLFVLIDNSSWWVNVNFEETQISRIKAGQSASVELDMYDHTYEGKVQSISYASGSTFSLLPPQNASGNWVKVAQRFPVKVILKNNERYPLRVGASAEVTVDTTD